ncbi:MAG: LOG family protein, partial [Bacteroidota bacterium]
QMPNQYISATLNFEFHYFFMRKLFFMSLANALVVFPGGFGTLDEFMEALTLVQTRKVQKHLPIVLYGSDFWDEVINMPRMVELGVISPEDLHLFHRSNDVQDAFDYLTTQLTKFHGLEP